MGDEAFAASRPEVDAPAPEGLTPNAQKPEPPPLPAPPPSGMADAIVEAVEDVAPNLQQLRVRLSDGTEASAVGYPALVGHLSCGDRVRLNTWAVDLGLGTGGWHFVIARLGTGENAGDRPAVAPVPDAFVPAHPHARARADPGSLFAEAALHRPESGAGSAHVAGESALQSHGHILKLRYTPLQHPVLAVEERASPHHEALRKAISLSGAPVICAEMHSHLAPAALGARAAALRAGRTAPRVIYVMTDEAALPLAFSDSVRALKAAGLLHATISAGQAFGGDLEAVCLPSALLAAQVAAGADVILVAQGPGIVGTGTAMGHGGAAQAAAVNAVVALEGRAIAVPRLSFADPRSRHQGISHHTLTALGRLALGRAVIPVPHLPPDHEEAIGVALEALARRHEIARRDVEWLRAPLAESSVLLSSMGRGWDADPWFFLASALAGALALE